MDFEIRESRDLVDADLHPVPDVAGIVHRHAKWEAAVDLVGVIAAHI